MHAVRSEEHTSELQSRGVNEHEIEVKRAELNECGSIFVDSNVV